MKKKEMIAPIILEFVLRNISVYLIFSLIYLDFNPLNWWLIQNVWGRVILLVIELSLLANIGRGIETDIRKLNETDKTSNKTDKMS